MNEILVLSVKSPWAYAILHGGKDYENRKWATKYRGRLFIHATALYSRAEVEECEDLLRRSLADVTLRTGCIMGTVDLLDIVTKRTAPSRSIWFEGPYGWHIANPRPLAIPVPAKGQQRLWTPNDQTIRTMQRENPWLVDAG